MTIPCQKCGVPLGKPVGLHGRWEKQGSLVGYIGCPLCHERFHVVVSIHARQPSSLKAKRVATRVLKILQEK